MVKSEYKIQPKPHKAMSPSSSSSSSSRLSPRVKNKYKGVRMRSWGSWVSEIRAPNQKTRIWLGSYSTAEEAARAYDAALICLKGTSSYTNLNFPTSASHCHIPASHDHRHGIMSPKSIQRVAAAAANSFLENGNHGNAIDNNASSPSSLSSYSSSSDQVEHDVTLVPSSVTDDHVIAQIDGNVPWYHEYYNLDCLSYSPKYDDHMFNEASFNQPMIEDLYEEEGIHLWNFS